MTTFDCTYCTEPLGEDDAVVWATREGVTTVAEVLPWCEDCAPPEPDYHVDRRCPHGLAPVAGPDRPCPTCEDEGYRLALAEEVLTEARRAYAEAELLRDDAWRAAAEASRTGRPSLGLWEKHADATEVWSAALERLRDAMAALKFEEQAVRR